MDCPKCSSIFFEEVSRLANATLILRRRECQSCGYWTITRAKGPDAPEEALARRVITHMRAYVLSKVRGRLRAENPDKSGPLHFPLPAA